MYFSMKTHTDVQLPESWCWMEKTKQQDSSVEYNLWITTLMCLGKEKGMQRLRVRSSVREVFRQACDPCGPCGSWRLARRQQQSVGQLYSDNWQPQIGIWGDATLTHLKKTWRNKRIFRISLSLFYGTPEGNLRWGKSQWLGKKRGKVYKPHCFSFKSMYVSSAIYINHNCTYPAEEVNRTLLLASNIKSVLV